MEQNQRRRKVLFWVQVLLGLALGLAALYLAAREVSFRELGLVLRSVSLPLLGLTLVSSLLSPVVKAIRWRWLFYPQRPALGLVRLTSLLALGQAINMLLLGRWGELVRAYFTGEEAGTSKSFVFGTIAAEKLLDMVVLAFLVVALIPFVALPPWLAARVGYVLVAALIISAIVLALLGGRDLWLRIAQKGLRILPRSAADRWGARLAAALDGLGALRNRRAAVAIWGWTLAAWLVAALINLLLLAAFGLQPSLRIALFLLVVLQAGVAVPSAPGKIGVFQFLCVLALSVFGVPASVAFGYGVVLYLIVLGSICVWAVFGLWQRGLSLRRLTRVRADWT
jgi:glycosyltransferase 2 family protein